MDVCIIYNNLNYEIKGFLLRMLLNSPSQYSKYMTNRIALFCVSQAVMTANAAIAEDKMVKIYSCKKRCHIEVFWGG